MVYCRGQHSFILFCQAFKVKSFTHQVTKEPFQRWASSSRPDPSDTRWVSRAHSLHVTIPSGRFVSSVLPASYKNSALCCRAEHRCFFRQVQAPELTLPDTPSPPYLLMWAGHSRPAFVLTAAYSYSIVIWETSTTACLTLECFIHLRGDLAPNSDSL